MNDDLLGEVVEAPPQGSVVHYDMVTEKSPSSEQPVAVPYGIIAGITCVVIVACLAIATRGKWMKARNVLAHPRHAKLKGISIDIRLSR